MEVLLILLAVVTFGVCWNVRAATLRHGCASSIATICRNVVLSTEFLRGRNHPSYNDRRYMSLAARVFEEVT